MLDSLRRLHLPPGVAPRSLLAWGPLGAWGLLRLKAGKALPAAPAQPRRELRHLLRQLPDLLLQPGDLLLLGGKQRQQLLPARLLHVHGGSSPRLSVSHLGPAAALAGQLVPSLLNSYPGLRLLLCRVRLGLVV